MGRYFITLEGGEGAGKTTVLHELEKELSKMGYSVVTTREPGGIEIAEKIREIILNPRHTNMDARTEALLYAAARRQHFIEKIKPALDQGKLVLCDRFIDSSLVYQGHARNLGIDEVLDINQFAIEGYMPSLTLLFHITPEEGLKRIEQNEKRERNRLDLENIHFHKEVYKGYEMIHERYPSRIKKINAHQSVQEVTAEALELIVTHLF